MPNAEVGLSDEKVLDEAALDRELEKRAILQQLAGVVKAKWKEGAWRECDFQSAVIFLDYTYDSSIITQAPRFFEEALAQFFLEIVGVPVCVSFVTNGLPCGGHTCKLQIDRRR